VVNELPKTPVIQADGPTTFCADQRVTLTATDENAYQWSNGLATKSIIVSQAGTYSLQTRNIFNCISAPSNAITINVNPLPDAPLISAQGRTTFCDGGQVILAAASPLKALWSSGEATQEIAIRRSGTFTARVQDGNGCFSPFSNAIAIDVKPVPVVPTILQTGTYTLEVTNKEPNTSFNWRFNTDSLASKSNTLKANQSGNYTTQAYRVYSADLTCFSAFSSPLPFILIADNEGLSIYPNPSADKKITIETLTDVRDATVRIFSLLGQEVRIWSVTDFTERRPVDLSDLRSGYYIIQVQSAGFNVSKRIFIGF